MVDVVASFSSSSSDEESEESESEEDEEDEEDEEEEDEEDEEEEEEEDDRDEEDSAGCCWGGKAAMRAASMAALFLARSCSAWRRISNALGASANVFLILSVSAPN